MVKSGGILAWNIADGYEGFNDFFLSYDKIIQEHISKGDWVEVMPVKKEANMLFDDAGYTHVMKKKQMPPDIYSADFLPFFKNLYIAGSNIQVQFYVK